MKLLLQLNLISDLSPPNSSLTKDNYELILHGLFREGSVLDHNKDPCSKTFIPNTKVINTINIGVFPLVLDVHLFM